MFSNAGSVGPFHFLTIISCCALALGCGDFDNTDPNGHGESSLESQIDDCLNTFTTDAGFGFGDADVATVEATCLDEGGAFCDRSQFITLDAALCVADIRDFDTGLRDWDARLLFHHGDLSPRWTVENLLEVSADSSSGESMAIEAWSGEHIETLGWAMVLAARP